MLKKFKKKSLKVKIAIIAFVVFMIALVSYVLYSTFKPEPPVEYEMSKVSYGTITDYLDVSGTVESGISKNFTALEGVVVEEVFVSVGDKVKNGDLLATFNVSGATQYVSDTKKDYDSALKDYNDAKTTFDENSKRKTELDKEISAIEKKIEKLEKEINALEKESDVSETEKNTEPVTFTKEQANAIVEQMSNNGATDEDVKVFIESVTVPNVTLPETTTSKVTETTTKAELPTLSQEQIDDVVKKMKDNGATKEEIKAFVESVTLPEVTVPETTTLSKEQIDSVVNQMKNNGATEEEIKAFIDSVSLPEAKPLTKEQIEAIVNKMKENGATEEEIKAFLESVKIPEVTVPETTKPEVTLPEVTVPDITPITQEQVNEAVSQMSNNGASKETIDAFTDSVTQIQPDVKIPDELPTVSAEPSNQEKLLQKNVELAQLKSELSSLQAENAVVVSRSDDSMLESLKAIADAKQVTYENVNKIYNEMKNGWYAENDGIVTVVNIKAGEKFVPVKENNSSFDLSSLIGDNINMEFIDSLMGGAATIPSGTGITLESYDDMIVSVTVGKSDLLKIKTGMKAIATSLESEYDAEVVYVGATAVDSSGSFDLNSLTSSLMGGAGGASGALVKVKINNPDEKVVIGFDVDVKIKLDTVEDVLKVPVESVIYNNGKYYVFVFDEEEGTAAKREIVKGSLDETSYEIVSGLVEGEKVLKSPDPNTVDGTRVAEKTA